jgi:hypothetical protein
MVVLVLGCTILLMRVRSRYLVYNANMLKESIKFLILPSPISLDCNNFLTEQSFNHALEIMKTFEHLRFML